VGGPDAGVGMGWTDCGAFIGRTEPTGGTAATGSGATTGGAGASGATSAGAGTAGCGSAAAAGKGHVRDGAEEMRPSSREGWLRLDGPGPGWTVGGAGSEVGAGVPEAGAATKVDAPKLLITDDWIAKTGQSSREIVWLVASHRLFSNVFPLV